MPNKFLFLDVLPVHEITSKVKLVCFIDYQIKIVKHLRKS